jgi:hypothetical protein
MERGSVGVHCIGGWVGPRAGLDALDKREMFAPVGFRASNFSFLVQPAVTEISRRPLSSHILLLILAADVPLSLQNFVIEVITKESVSQVVTSVLIVL